MFGFDILTGCLAVGIFGGVCLSVDAIIKDGSSSSPPPEKKTEDEIWRDLEKGYVPHE